MRSLDQYVMCVSFPAFEIAGELLVVSPPPFSCIVVIGKIWVFFFIITFFFSCRSVKGFKLH